MAAHIIQAFPAAPASAPARATGFGVQKAWALLSSMMRARQTRQTLADMDYRLLADIGVSPADAHMEASRPFWDTTPRR